MRKEDFWMKNSLLSLNFKHIHFAAAKERKEQQLARKEQELYGAHACEFVFCVERERENP